MRVDPRTALDIDLRIEKILREMRVRDPPIRMEDVIAHLRLHKSYYDLNDPNLLQEIHHRLRIGASFVKNLVTKVSLKGLFLPDQKRILIDASVEQLKRKWVEAHETTHRIIPTHNEFLLGDTAETLDPDYHEMIEAEANYGASALIFLGKRFTEDAIQTSTNLVAIKALGKRYQNTISTTLLRYVQHSHDKPMIGIVSVPKWKQAEGDLGIPRRYAISSAFGRMFSKTPQQAIMAIVDGYAQNKKGPAGSSSFSLYDDNGGAHEFTGESFFNTYDLLTLIVHHRKL